MIKPGMSQIVFGVAGGILLALGIGAGLYFVLNSIADARHDQACFNQASERNYSMLTDKYADYFACLDDYSYQRLPESMKQEYRQLVWDTMGGD